MDEDIAGFDCYGFAFFKEGTDSFEDDQRFHDLSDNEDDRTNENTVEKIMKSLNNTNLCSPIKLRAIIRGHKLPSCVRQKLWNHALDTSALKSNTCFSYQESLGEVRSFLVDLGVSEYGHKNFITDTGNILATLVCEDTDPSVEQSVLKQLTALRQIMLDVGRSFPTHCQFLESTEEGREGLASLFRILAVYVNYNPQVSYCQGMSYIAGMLLMNMSEEDAFWALVTLFERAKYLTGYFDSSLSKIQRHAQVFEKLMQQRMPLLFKHLETCGVYSLMYITPWFMSVFTSLPCWDAVLTIWDLILLDGFPVIFQVALSIMDVLSERLLKETELAFILPLLLHLPTELMRHNVLVPVIFRNKVQKWEIDSIQQVIAEEVIIKQEKENGKRSMKDNDDTLVATKKRKVLREQQPDHKPLSMLRRVVDIVTWPFKSTPPIQSTVNTRPVHLSIQANDQSPEVFSPMCCTLPPSASKLIASGTGYGIVKQQRQRHVPPAQRGYGRPMTRNHIKGLNLNSPVRRSPRMVARTRNSPYKRNKFMTPRSQKLITSSASDQHAFRVFNTPTPLRVSQVKSIHRRRSGLRSGNNSPSGLSPMDIELREVRSGISPVAMDVAMQLAFCSP